MSRPTIKNFYEAYKDAFKEGSFWTKIVLVVLCPFIVLKTIELIMKEKR